MIGEYVCIGWVDVSWMLVSNIFWGLELGFHSRVFVYTFIVDYIWGVWLGFSFNCVYIHMLGVWVSYFVWE